MPPLVQQQLPQITQHIGILSNQVYEERIKSLESNEKFVREGFQEDSDEEELEEDDFDDKNVDPGVEFDKMKKALKNFRDGKPVSDDEISDDERDSEYEENAGEFCIYDSPLEETDELITVKATLDAIFQADHNAYQFIVSA